MARLIHMLLCAFESLTSNITQIDPGVTSVLHYVHTFSHPVPLHNAL